MRLRCTHLTTENHCRTLNGVRVWTCTKCKFEGPWEEGWRYFGSLECVKCSSPQVDVVHCPACKDAANDLLREAEKQRRLRDREANAKRR